MIINIARRQDTSPFFLAGAFQTNQNENGWCQKMMQKWENMTQLSNAHI